MIQSYYTINKPTNKNRNIINYNESTNETAHDHPSCVLPRAQGAYYAESREVAKSPHALRGQTRATCTHPAPGSAQRLNSTNPTTSNLFFFFFHHIFTSGGWVQNEAEALHNLTNVSCVNLHLVAEAAVQTRPSAPDTRRTVIFPVFASKLRILAQQLLLDSP